MIINWIRAKKAEYKVKAIFYNMILSLIGNQDKISDYINIVSKLFDELSNVSQDELVDKFVETMSGIIHERNEENRAYNEYGVGNVEFGDKDE